MLYNDACDVPDGDYTIPFGEGVLVREGEHATVVATGQMVKLAAGVVDKLAAEGIRCDLIDPRTTSPLDEDTIIESVEGTGRLVIVDESPPRCGIASDIAAIVAQKAFRSLKRPIIQVTAPHTPIPFAPALERLYVPGPPRIEAAIRQALKDE
jgi:pyruvate dehydrogenase E1 component beta subunit